MAFLGLFLYNIFIAFNSLDVSLSISKNKLKKVFQKLFQCESNLRYLIDTEDPTKILLDKKTDNEKNDEIKNTDYKKNGNKNNRYEEIKISNSKIYLLTFKLKIHIMFLLLIIPLVIFLINMFYVYRYKSTLKNNMLVASNYYWFAQSSFQIVLNSLYTFKYNDTVSTTWGFTYDGITNATDIMDDIVEPTYKQLSGKDFGSKGSKYKKIIVDEGPMCDLISNIIECRTYFEQNWNKNAIFALSSIRNGFTKNVNSFESGLRNIEQSLEALNQNTMFQGYKFISPAFDQLYENST